MKMTKKNKSVFSWALYDWANSTFATTVMAGFFPIFFKQYWASDMTASESTFQLGITNAVASLVIVCTAPILGAIADYLHWRKQFLIAFALLGVLATGCMVFVSQNQWPLAATCFCFGAIGFMGANIFYDALLVEVSDEHNRDFVSGLGYALGYLGGGLLFAINVAMTLSPESFGLSDAASAVKLSFLSVSLWWAIFSVPLILYVEVRRKAVVKVHITKVIFAGITEVKRTLLHIAKLKNVFLFLLAYWMYIDGVDTVVRMAVDYGLSIGLQQESLITALLITQFVGFPSALAFGYLGQKIGARTGIFIAIAIYIAVLIGAYFIQTNTHFMLLAMSIGLVQGGIQSLSRSLYSEMIPADHAAEFFGFYNMMGKSAALLGPLMIGAVAYWLDDHRLAMLSIIILFLIGAILLYKVKVKKILKE